MTPSEEMGAAAYSPAMNLANRLVATRYDVLEPLGEGVLVASFRARDRLLNRIVTLKTPLASFAAREDVRRSLRDGLGRVMGLAHPGIVRVYDVGEEGENGGAAGLFYSVEEYVRGLDLKERIRRVAPFQLTAATEMVISLAEALEYGLTRGIAHGDVRPQNVLVGTAGAGTEGNGIKLTGFGTAEAQSLAIADDPTTLRRVVPYRALEVARESAPTPSADVYALGVILYELLTGELPFRGENAFEIVAQHAQAAVPLPSAANASVPAAFDSIVVQAMAKRQEDRYPSATEMLRDLRAVRDSLRHGKPPTWTPAIRSVPSAPISPVAEPDLLAPLPLVDATAKPVARLTEASAPAPPQPVQNTEVAPYDPYSNSSPETTVPRTLTPRAAWLPAAAPSTSPPPVAATPSTEPSASEKLREQSQQKAPERAVATLLYGRASVPSAANAVTTPITPTVPAIPTATASASVANQTGNRRAGVTPAPAMPEKEEVPVKRRNRGDEEDEGGGRNRYIISINLILVLLVLVGIGFLGWQFSRLFRPAEDVIVPNLVGKTTTDAKALAAQEKFDLAVVDEQYRDSDAVDVIYQMQPAAGRHIREGKSVEIWVSKGPHMVPVPDVTTKSLDDARQVLIANNLKEGDRTGEFDPFTPKGDVIRQVPEGGGMAPRGGKINLVVSKGEEPSPPPEPVTTPQPEPSDNPVAPPVDNPTPAPTEHPATPRPTPTPNLSISPNKHRSFDITYTVPKDNVSHHVRIDVTDRDGTRTVFDETHKGGDRIRQSIEAVGREIHFRIFDNDVLSKEQTI